MKKHISIILLLNLMIVLLFPGSSFAAINAEKAVKDAEVAGNALRAVSVYSGKGKPVSPDKQIANANAKLKVAKGTVGKLPAKQKQTFSKRLNAIAQNITIGTNFSNAIKRGETISVIRNKGDQATTVVNAVTAYNTLTKELINVSIFEKVTPAASRTNLTNYYLKPAQATVQKLAPVVQANSLVNQLNMQLNPLTDSEDLAKTYKAMVIQYSSVTQAALKKELSGKIIAVENRIPLELVSGSLLQILEFESKLRNLDSEVQPRKSSPVVPSLFQEITTTISSNLFVPTERVILQNRLKTIMSKLVIQPKELKDLLTQKAIEKGIPPEIVKGIVLTENAKMTQFQANGEVFKSLDGGFGIMQVTPMSEKDNSFDWDFVKYDLHANIDAGLSVLLEKWNKAGKLYPLINKQNKLVLEDWYFALWAYNGLSNFNDPSNPNAKEKVYQEKVYKNIEDYVGVTPSFITSTELKVNNIDGWPSFTEKINYVTKSSTMSSQMHKEGTQLVLKKKARFRTAPSTSGTPTELLAGTKIQIVKRVEDVGLANFFSWYLVKLPNGKQGYIASVNLY
ncbi:SH3 domain-containing protein [Peribacillus acanthi]|uniref:SH3 domain-containing protein n=1 Tax=Peribacillus acanthi TaxID=2171554 RepID=UPI000D3ECCFC|nr:SH3 domain-containing protein [Peribacillus acanthi]